MNRRKFLSGIGVVGAGLLLPRFFEFKGLFYMGDLYVRPEFPPYLICVDSADPYVRDRDDLIRNFVVGAIERNQLIPYPAYEGPIYGDIKLVIGQEAVINDWIERINLEIFQTKTGLSALPFEELSRETQTLKL